MWYMSRCGMHTNAYITYVIEASRGFLQLSVPRISIRLKGVAKQTIKRAMTIIVWKLSPKTDF